MCAPIAARISAWAISTGGGFLMHRASQPLYFSGGCNLARVPSGRPSLSFSTFRRVLLMAKDLLTKGLIVGSIRSLTVDGYVRWACWGYARTSSLEIFINSTVSRVPRSSVALYPAALYLKVATQVNNIPKRLLRTYPADIPSSPCSNFIFSSNGNLMVSAPISNIPFTSLSAPWFFKL